MSRPVLIDVGCGLGGATKGYQRAGFHVVGVDVAPELVGAALHAHVTGASAAEVAA